MSVFDTHPPEYWEEYEQEKKRLLSIGEDLSVKNEKMEKFLDELDEKYEKMGYK